MKLTGPFTFGGTYVLDHNGEIACSTATEADAERIAADLNLADSIAAEPNIEVTLALHRLVGTRKRLSSLQTGSPHDLDLMGEIPEEYFGREGTEAFWHRVYRRFHHSREWFQFPDEEAAKLRMLLDDRKRRARKAEEIFLVSSMRRVEDNLRMSTGATRRATERGK